jgi:hypothetical protein
VQSWRVPSIARSARSARFAALVALASLLTAGCTTTQELFVPIGLNAGGVVHRDPVPTGSVIGAEVSAVVATVDRVASIPFDVGAWKGGYADVLWDTGSDRVRMSLGPEIGWAFFGLDGGPLLQIGGGAVHPGFATRVLVTLGFVSTYVRMGGVAGDHSAQPFTEFGALLKYPIHLGSL